MATDKQTDANRLNAQKSTGPRTAEGKAAVRFNAVKLGISANSMVLDDEDPDQLADLAAAYRADCRPSTARQLALVHILIRCDWFMRRFDRLEALFVSRQMNPKDNIGDALAEIYGRPAIPSNPIVFLARRRAAVQREWFRANRELLLLQETQPPEVAETEELTTEAPPPEAPQSDFDKTNPISGVSPAKARLDMPDISKNSASHNEIIFFTYGSSIFHLFQL